MKLYSIQYLRALAVLMVVMFHAASNMGDHYWFSFRVLRFGEYGVDLFFVISGFIITITTAPKISSMNFFWKRLIRIVPLYWTVTLTYALVDWVHPGLLRSGTSNLRHLLSSLFFIPSYHPRFPGNIWPTIIQGWSLNYEMFFYSVFAVVMAVTTRSRTRALIVIGLLLTFIGLGQIIVTGNEVMLTYTSPLLLEFVFGILIGETFLQSNAAFTRWVFLFFLILAVAMVLFQSEGSNLWRSLIVGPLCTALILLTLFLEQSSVTFGSQLVIRIGDASYAIYLTHFVAVATLRMILERSSLTQLGSVGASIVILLTTVLSCVLGLAVFVFLEKPMGDYLRQLGTKNSSQPRDLASPDGAMSERSCDS